MQLTNFLRDVREDYEELDRIYMPSEILKRYGLSHDDIGLLIAGKQDDDIIFDIKKESRKLYMQYMIAECRTMYIHSLDGLQYLNPE
jgi:phytoene/squalene synthetase